MTSLSSFVLDSFNLRQHIDVHTHTKGHTLDLVVTDLAPVNNLCVYDLGVSDHEVISMGFPFLSLLIKPKGQISFRNFKKIDSDCLAADLQHFISINTFSINETVDFYMKTLGSILDIHVPVRVRTVPFSRSAPWFTSKQRRMKAACHVIE